MPELEIFNWAREWCAPSSALEDGAERKNDQSPLQMTADYFSNCNEMEPQANDARQEAEEAQRRLAKAMGHIRFPLIGAKDLLTTVKPLGIVPSDILLEAIEYQLVEGKPPHGEILPSFRPRRAFGGSAEEDEARLSDGGVDGRVRPVAVAMRVERGPDWKWGDQDGGVDAKGVITAVGPAEGGPSDGWVRIRWDNGHVNVYRWGADGGKYDLQPSAT